MYFMASNTSILEMAFFDSVALNLSVFFIVVENLCSNRTRHALRTSFSLLVHTKESLHSLLEVDVNAGMGFCPLGSASGDRAVEFSHSTHFIETCH
mmetsp:Transcript_12112/g.22426  ORF Transcript_12112/g.22426 Transcript_12112/m.22426 type:complete len:96 (+) Transcript_12112:1008-1295(+)